MWARTDDLGFVSLERELSLTQCGFGARYSLTDCGPEMPMISRPATDNLRSLHVATETGRERTVGYGVGGSGKRTFDAARVPAAFDPISAVSNSMATIRKRSLTDYQAS